jgi:sugar (pentulose or hexulose) kinase
MSQEYLVGVDSGTQSVRVAVIDPHGNTISSGTARHEPMFQLSPGWAEQHPEDIWAKFCQAAQQAMAGLPVPKSALVAAGLTGQRSTTALLDPDGNPLRPFVIWVDPRRKKWVDWIRTHEPDNLERTYKIGSVQAWLVKRLTGEFNDCVGYPVIGPIDLDRLALSDDPAAYESFGMPREKVVDAYPPGTVVGLISREAAAETGLPEGLPVAVGAGDKQCEVLGGGAILPGQAYVTYGTLSSLLITTYARPLVSATGEYRSIGAAVPGAWNPELSLMRGHWIVTWFKEEFGHQAVEEAAKRGVSPEQVLNEEAGRVPPGSQGLVVFPYWEARPSVPEATGLILGFYDGVHTRAHVFRAILEGIAYGLRRGLETLACDSGVPIRDVTVGGGGSKSDPGMQITADIFGVPCKRPHTAETCVLGAAMEAAVGIGMYPDFGAAVRTMTRSRDCFEPIPANQALYDAVYDRVFTRIYPALEGVFANLNQIRTRGG